MGLGIFCRTALFGFTRLPCCAGWHEGSRDGRVGWASLLLFWVRGCFGGAENGQVLFKAFGGLVGSGVSATWRHQGAPESRGIDPSDSIFLKFLVFSDRALVRKMGSEKHRPLDLSTGSSEETKLGAVRWRTGGRAERGGGVRRPRPTSNQGSS